MTQHTLPAQLSELTWHTETAEAALATLNACTVGETIGLRSNPVLLALAGVTLLSQLAVPMV